jgi:hypothetical protein
MREGGRLARRGAEYGAAVLAATGLISLLPRRAGPGLNPHDAGTEAQHNLPPAKWERKDVAFAPMAIAGAGVLVVLVGAAGLAFWLYPLPDKTLRFQPPVTYPGPALQDDPVADMNRFRAEQLRQLNGIYWLDKAAGTVHLPIEDAMRLVASEGIKDWPKTPYPPSVPAR